MNFDVPRRFRLGSAVPAAIAAALTALACGGSTASTDSQAQSALSADTSSGDEAAKLTGCLTSYVECVRGGSDGKTCHEAFHACAGHGKGHHGERGEGDRDGDRDGRGCDGDADGGRPAPPPPPSGSAAPPPPPPGGDARPDDDGDRPPPPGGAAGDDKGGPRACFDALDTCAKGSDAVETCVSAAVACFQALPKPPHGDHDRRPPGGGNGAPPPPAPSGSAAPAN